VNDALDRPALAESFNDAPDDQIVPPAVPGFAPGRSYPIGGPDLAAARRLTDGRRFRARLYFCGNPQQRKVASIVSSNLARIGIAVTIDQAESCPADFRYDARSRRADLILFNGLYSEERDPQPFLEQALARDGAFGSALGRGLWTSRQFRRALARARALRGVRKLGLVGVLLAQGGLQGVPGRVRLRRSRQALQTELKLRTGSIPNRYPALGRSRRPVDRKESP
jgi:hypothetical protein